jgi:hypothetical protein
MEANAGPMTNLKRALDGLRDHCRARRYPALFSFMLGDYAYCKHGAKTAQLGRVERLNR